MSSTTTNEYESNYDSGGGIIMSTNDMAYSYHNNNSFGSGTSSSRSSGSTVKTSFFQSSNQSKYEDLKQMLENSKELLKLEAMKRIITMVAKGRSAESARELFPHVVKNVVTKNTELKKLVYLYLTRYAEQEQDLALLSIATFQHALKDPNPLIRGSAIRVLSSIRVPMISPIVLIAIKDCANDMSPYVRKIAAHAIPKLVSLDADIKDEVIDIIAKLLADKVSLVLGSAVAAFEEVCPERFDLIHQNYRKLCQLLVDVDEWGQIIIINMLVRYARTQFINPNQSLSLSSPSRVDPDHLLLIRSLYLSVAPHFEITASLVRPLIRLLHSHYEIQLIILKNIVTLTSAEFNQKWLEDNGLVQRSNNDDDHNNKSTATQQSSQLLMSTDSNCVHHRQTNGEIRKESDDEESNDADDNNESDTEDQSNNRTPMIRTIKSLFEPYLKSFFVKANDSTQIKILKLEILTNLSNTGNYISLVLREFQAYIMNYQDDLEFMSATIESIGQCASRIKEIAPVCLNGLVSLLSNRNETIVAQSIVVIRTQIINKDQTIISMIVKQIVRLMTKISTPQARATIVWIVAEFCHRNRHARRLAPNVLLQIAKSFCHEHDLVKLQAMNLAAKLSITMIDDNVNDDGCGQQINTNLEPLDIDRERLKSLISYVFNLAKYDLNYDVRDRGRFLKHLIGDPLLARRLLLMPKQQPNVSQRNHLLVQQQQQIAPDVIMADQLPPPPTVAIHQQQCLTMLASSNDSSRYRFGTLSHFLGKRMQDYEELPDYPTIAPDSNVRKQPEPIAQPKSIDKSFTLTAINNNNDDKFRLRPRNGFLDDDVDEEGEEEDEEEDSDDYEDEDEEEVEVEDDEQEDEEEYEEVDDDDEDEEDDNDDVEEGDEEEEEEVMVEEVKPIPTSKHLKQKSSKSRPHPSSDVDLLLDLSDLNINGSNIMTAVSPLHQPLLPMMMMASSNSIVQSQQQQEPYRILESPESVTYKEFELLDVTATDGFKVSYRFPRINEATKTLVELVVKCTLKIDDNRNQNRITIQPPSNGSIQFKNVEYQADDNQVVIPILAPDETRLVTLAVDFNESPSLGIELKFNRIHSVKLVAPLGDILYPVRFRTVDDFLQERSKLTGMNEVTGTVRIESSQQTYKCMEQLCTTINQILLNLANVCTNQHFSNINNDGDTTTTSDDNNQTLYYSACTVKFRSLILITIKIETNNNDNDDDNNQWSSFTMKTIVNCEKMVLGSMMSKLIKDESQKKL
ncbi:AP-3 complex subunit beta-2 [Dermatophagoides farinae]|uniref:AP-3 complex subunit beta-2 n=1 Tax=Dermatophagoides farinae TaxID=6954 RepID=A0A922HF60_DERFA|nr:AP-3 complex subunit beta-2 [Dermatophagoides farinae]